MRLVLRLDESYSPRGPHYRQDQHGMWDLFEWSEEFAYEVGKNDGILMPGYAPYYHTPSNVWMEMEDRIRYGGG